MSVKVEKGDAADGGFILVEGNIHLSRREVEVLAFIGNGLSNEEIAAKLYVSENTVRNHAYNVMKKLGAKNRAHALVLAAQNGIVTIGHEKNLVRPGIDEYILCWYCNRAFTVDELVEVEQEPFTVDHVTYEPPPELGCPYKDCRKTVSLTDKWWHWSEVRKEHPEFPERPEKGKVYRLF